MKLEDEQKLKNKHIEAYINLITTTKSQIELLKQDNESDKFISQIEIRKEQIKYFENQLKELS